MPPILPGYRWSRALVAAGLLAAAGGASAATTCVPTARPGVEECVSGLPVAVMRQIQQVQAASNWCWAAVVSMVLQRHGLHVPQSEVVQAQLGAPLNEKVALDDLRGLLNRSWRDAAGRALQASASVLPNWWRLQGLAAPDVLEELHQEKPLVMVAQDHAMLLVQVVYERSAAQGMRLVRATVLDPATGGGLRNLRPSERQMEYLARVQVRPADDGVLSAQRESASRPGGFAARQHPATVGAW